MSGFLAWAVRHPLHCGILAGIIVAVVFGLTSLPNESSIEKTVEDWLPANAAQDDDTINELITALDTARDNGSRLERVSEVDFRDLDLVRSAAVPQAEDGGVFKIEYVGQAANDDTVYLAERKVEAAPWWHPDRLLYRAATYEIDRFGTGLHLTFERDWGGIGSLLLLDAVIGAMYGTMIGLVLAAFNSKGLDIPGSRGLNVPGPASARQLPAETPLTIFKTGKFEPD